MSTGLYENNNSRNRLRGFISGDIARPKASSSGVGHFEGEEIENFLSA